ncbi:MAG: V-type ATP synthase subunit F [Ruminococcus sp.]|nr:V-type ATP synthase subunit F [Ruminococcus sp.]
MKLYLISDNLDTQMGMRLAGIDGVVVHGEQETAQALSSAMEKSDIGIILMTPEAVKCCSELVSKYKLERATPLITEIPDRHAETDVTAAISRYLREAVGV